MHDWEDREDPEGSGTGWSHGDVVFAGSMFFLYPSVVALALLPGGSILTNLVFGGLVLVTMVALSTRPVVAVPIFAFWSVAAPLGLAAHPSFTPFSVGGLLVCSAFWVPLLISTLVGYALRQ